MPICEGDRDHIPGRFYAPAGHYLYGKPLTTVEAIEREWCSKCSGTAQNVREHLREILTESLGHPATAGEVSAASLLLSMVWLVRISPEQPALRCDDEREWQTIERELRRERDTRLDTEFAALGIKAGRRMTRTARAVLLAEAAQNRASHPPLPDAREGLLRDDGWLVL